MIEILKVTGIAGLALWGLFSIFKNIVKKNIFPVLDPKEGFKILTRIINYIFIIAIISIVSYLILKFNDKKISNESRRTLDNTKRIENAGNENIIIQGDNNSINK